MPIPVTSFNAATYQGRDLVHRPRPTSIRTSASRSRSSPGSITTARSRSSSRRSVAKTSCRAPAPPDAADHLDAHDRLAIRLKDGETNLLAGLYQRDESKSESRVPLLSDIPLLGRLFTSKSKDRQTVDLVLTLTPYIVRFPDISEEDLAPLWVGTRAGSRTRDRPPASTPGARTAGRSTPAVAATDRISPTGARAARAHRALGAAWYGRS